MRLCDLPDNPQPKAHPADLAGRVLLNLQVALEHAVQELVWDARPVVRDGEPERAILPALSRHPHLDGAPLREFHGVIRKLLDHESEVIHGQ